MGQEWRNTNGRMGEEEFSSGLRYSWGSFLGMWYGVRAHFSLIISSRTLKGILLLGWHVGSHLTLKLQWLNILHCITYACLKMNSFIGGEETTSPPKADSGLSPVLGHEAQSSSMPPAAYSVFCHIFFSQQNNSFKHGQVLKTFQWDTYSLSLKIAPWNNSGRNIYILVF